MAKIYFEKRQPVKPEVCNKGPYVATYIIAVGGKRLPVRATHHDLLDMLPGILSEGGRISQVCRQEKRA
ncbi:hypothetical protein [Desulfovibrio sp. 86]|uniref:Uncharacterized protein n=1 Tax=uncultured Desulfovibrio sp. TaxID=167968 RepID=A0A212KXE6_9BACT|nr:hypothetical protein [Desulfovibrio sp. 86]SCM69971.1 hypothetical protein KL86DES1_10094 [uncultured Desulfovibrio sp.]VZH35306.1 conserved protein of unknown function [Desulfovibrio sp. 86]